MNKDKGYNYLGSSDDLKDSSYTKIGKCNNIINRLDTYNTSFPSDGFVPYMIIVCACIMDAQDIEKVLHTRFKEFNLWYLNKDKKEDEYFNGGKEWYNKNFNKEDIITILDEYDYEYTILEDEKLAKFIEKEKRICYKNKKEYFKELESFEGKKKKKPKNPKKKKKPTPTPIQKEILDLKYFSNNDIGYYELPCGIGKTLLSLFQSKQIKAKKILIGVPSINLVLQFKDEIKKLYDNVDILSISSHEDSTTNVEKIKTFLNSNNKYKIIVTTYYSCGIIEKICKDNFIFDFKIGDEAHHLVGSIYKDSNNETEIRSFKKFIFIKSEKTLYMTATPKIVDEENKDNYFSMNDEKIFGKMIYKKSVKWAIENDYITDYYINFIKNTETQIDDILKTIKIKVENKELFLSAYMTLKSMEQFDNLSHVLIYSNTTAHSDLINKYIKQILSKKVIKINKSDIYHKSLHSNLNKDKYESSNRNKSSFDLKKEISLFKNKKYGIISCVQIFGEGFNEPKLNGIVISENMESETRIIQSCLRPHRKEEGNINKIAYIICPFIDNSSNAEIDLSFSKIKQITKHLRNVDDNIVSRMKLYDYKECSKPKPNKKELEAELTENDKALQTLKFKLRHSKSLSSDLNEEEDYYKMLQSKNKELNIKSDEEYEKKKTLNNEYIKNPDIYFTKQGLWNNWYDFLGINTSAFIKTKEEWIKFCKKKNINNLNYYYECCNIYKELPYMYDDFYIGFTTFKNELGISKRRK